MKKLILFFLLNTSLLYSQDKLVQFDAVTFSETDTSGRIEIYYSFNNNLMQNSEHNINGAIDVNITSADKKYLYLNKEYTITMKNDNAKNMSTGMLKFSLLSGTYFCRLKGKDLNNNKLDSLSFNFIISGYNNDHFSISNIQFASNIYRDPSASGIFVKNNYVIIPDVVKVFGDNLPVLYYYLEIYNLNKSISHKVSLETKVLDKNDIEIFNRQKIINNDVVSRVFADVINVSKISSGYYSLQVTLQDSLGSYVARRRRFLISNSSIPEKTENTMSSEVLNSEFAALDSSELELMFEKSKYIASVDEINIWNNIKGLNRKRYFLYSFWKKRDENKLTPFNEFKYEYFKRVNIADERYAAFQKEGWFTDKGRVYILYGEPDEIERFPVESKRVPYEIWHYYKIQGGVYFVFAEIFAFSDMVLVHSTKRGELNDPNWKQRIIKVEGNDAE